MVYFNDFQEAKIYQYTGHWNCGRNVTMVDFVSERCMKMGLFPYMASKTSFEGDGSVVVDSLFIVVGILCLVLVLLLNTLCPFSFAVILMGKEESWVLYVNCLLDVL